MLAERHAKDGITVNIVAPGLIKTERLVEVAHGNPDSATPAGMQRLFERWAAEIPAGRLGEPSEVGEAVAFLASERAAYVTGQIASSMVEFKTKQWLSHHKVRAPGLLKRIFYVCYRPLASFKYSRFLSQKTIQAYQPHFCLGARGMPLETRRRWGS